jgi:anthranilate synthase component II
MKLLVLDNYDSFVYNLAQAFRSLGAETKVVRNDAWTIADVKAFAPDALVISPGPGHPANLEHFGICTQVIRELGPSLPMLGVCLGHQGIVHAFGGHILKARQVMHGKSSNILHDETGLFEGIPQAFEAMRYHSLTADPQTLPACLTVTARTADGIIMAITHKTAPIHGVQFHPESIGTPKGKQLLSNFLQLAKQYRSQTGAQSPKPAC